jgi:hypothetical protein
MKNIFDISKTLSEDYDAAIEIAEGLEYSVKATNKQIDYITNSKYLSGNLDDFGREKPYYNIANYRLNVAIRATDFDTKDVTIVSETRDYVRSLLIGKRVQQWMKDKVFAKDLNRMGEKEPKYGWILIKNVKDQDGDLDIQIVKHSNAIINQADPFSEPIKELHPGMTRAQLVGKRGIWDDTAIEYLLSLDIQSYDICEVTGEMPDSVDGGSEDDYSMYRFFIYEGAKDEEGSILFKEKLKKGTTIEDYYRFSGWAEQDGRLPRGVIEDMFEAQTGTNEVKLLERDAMIMASKTGFVTDGETLENNVITDLDNGFIINLEKGETFTQVNTMTNALPAFDRLKDDWDNQAEKVTSTFDALTGETLPSGTPFRSVAIQNQEASSLFIYRRENRGIFLTELFNDWIIPEIVKDINREWILSAEFNAEELAKIDERFGIYKANDVIKKKLMNLELDVDFTAEKYEEAIQSYVTLVQETDNTRFLEVPKDYFQDFKFKVSVITTNEQRNKAATLESLSNILGQVSSTYDPNTGTFAMLENPALASIFSQAVELSGAGISPVTLNKLQSSAGSKNVAPQQAQSQPEGITEQTGSQTEGVN